MEGRGGEQEGEQGGVRTDRGPHGNPIQHVEWVLLARMALLSHRCLKRRGSSWRKTIKIQTQENQSQDGDFALKREGCSRKRREEWGEAEGLGEGLREPPGASEFDGGLGAVFSEAINKSCLCLSNEMRCQR